MGAVALLQGATLLLVGGVFYFTDLFPMMIAEKAKSIAPQFVRPLQAIPLSREVLELRLEQLREELEKRAPESDRGFGWGINASRQQKVLLAILARDGRLLATSPAAALPRAEGDRPVRPEKLSELTALALGGERDSTKLACRFSDGTLMAVAPIYTDPAEQGELLGALTVQIYAPFSLREFLRKAVRDLLPIFTVLTLLTGTVGMAFGFFMARRLTRRLSAISAATTAWSHGDFSSQAPERPGDELGELGRRLNEMSHGLRGLIALQQDLASLKERQRLARDLHDTVKQQAFSCAMHLGAATRLLPRDPAAAAHRLDDASQLVQTMQRELSEVIGDLTPRWAGAELAKRLRDFVSEWSHTHGIPAHWTSRGTVQLRDADAQTLFRIAQEALANAARHSAATRVEVTLTAESGEIVLTVLDNGRGFDPVINASAGMGLSNMRERAGTLAGGTLVLTTHPGRGTSLVARCRDSAA